MGLIVITASPEELARLVTGEDLQLVESSAEILDDGRIAVAGYASDAGIASLHGQEVEVAVVLSPEDLEEQRTLLAQVILDGKQERGEA